MNFMEDSRAAKARQDSPASSQAMTAVVNALAVTDRERFLDTGSFPGLGILENSIALLREDKRFDRIIGVANDAATIKILEANGVESLHVNIHNPGMWRWGDVVKVMQNIPDDLPLAVISPYAGPISESRLISVCDTYFQNGGGIVASAYNVPDNANPSWLHVVPQQLGKRAYFKNYTKGLTYVPTMKKRIRKMKARLEHIAGAQWLPLVYKIDAAIVIADQSSLNGSVENHENWDICIADIADGSPVFAYGLPIWMVAEDVSLSV